MTVAGPVGVAGGAAGAGAMVSLGVADGRRLVVDVDGDVVGVGVAVGGLVGVRLGLGVGDGVGVGRTVTLGVGEGVTSTTPTRLRRAGVFAGSGRTST
ncbi:MAG: hypothetical protein ACQSGP_00375 [Frankia sp.]